MIRCLKKILPLILILFIISCEPPDDSDISNNSNIINEVYSDVYFKSYKVSSENSDTFSINWEVGYKNEPLAYVLRLYATEYDNIEEAEKMSGQSDLIFAGACRKGSTDLPDSNCMNEMEMRCSINDDKTVCKAIKEDVSFETWEFDVNTTRYIVFEICEAFHTNVHCQTEYDRKYYELNL